MAGRSDRAPRTMLEALLRSRDTATYRDVIDEFDSVAKSLGARATMSPRHLMRIAAGECGASPQVRRVLQKMFGRPAEDLLVPMEPDLPIVHSPGIDRSPVSVEEQVMSAAKRARRFTMSHEAGPTTVVVDQLMDDLAAIARDYQVKPIGEILPSLTQLQDDAFTLVETKKLRPQFARDLYLVAGVTTGLLAKASHDLAKPNAAVTQARAAYLCAEQADHDGLRAWIHGLQALVCYWAGRHTYALQHTRHGATFAKRSGGTSVVWLYAAEARSMAALGDFSGAEETILQAQDAREGVEGDDLDNLGGICTFGLPRQQYYAADALAWSPAAADQAKSHAIESLESHRKLGENYAFSDASGAAADLAIAHINSASPDLDGALTAIQPVLDLAPGQRINGIVHSLDRVSESIRRSELANETQAHEIIEAVEDFSAVTAAGPQEG
ncbi:hypothetical protein L0U85_03780 [Glycomyces sp. L485]|uniref:hypothetical protein n=1 Tax=Glycomyces sp. L485 TaxID=2909235 RepID=UPI001F4A3514|nr:hypothetical protein [Glycomyces sp. L485]MCH7229982.1 hypothetical protein [Glycomyces sp. L485]